MFINRRSETDSPSIAKTKEFSVIDFLYQSHDGKNMAMMFTGRKHNSSGEKSGYHTSFPADNGQVTQGSAGSCCTAGERERSKDNRRNV